MSAFDPKRTFRLSFIAKLKIARTWALALLCFSISARTIFLLIYKGVVTGSAQTADYVVLIPVGLVTGYLSYLFVVTARRELRMCRPK